MDLNISIPQHEVLIVGNTTASFVRVSVFAVDGDGNQTGSALYENDFAEASGAIAAALHGVNITAAGNYAVFASDLDQSSVVIPGTEQTYPFTVSSVAAPDAGGSVAGG